MQKFLKLSSVAAVILVFITQVYSFFYVKKIDPAEGYSDNAIPLIRETYTYGYGFIELRLIEPRPGENIKVCVNGEVVSTFDSEIMKIPVRENDYIELLNVSVTDNVVAARVTGMSPEFDVKFIHSDVNSTDGRACIGRIFLKIPAN